MPGYSPPVVSRRTQPQRIVLSGPIGAGKTTVRGMLAAMGCVVIDGDSVGHSVLLPDGPAFDAVAARWSDAVVDGAIDRRALAAVVFADPAELDDLVAITHPAIAAEIARRVEEAGDRDVVVELPLIEGIVEETTRWHRLVVLAEDDVRLRRLLARGMDEEDARRRMAAQPDLPEWERSAASIIRNDGDFGDLAAAVDVWWAKRAADVDG